MKKRLMALVILVIVLASLLSACAMFPINGDRQFHQVVATVNYNGMTAELYRGELLNYVLANGGSLLNYLTVDQIVEYFYNNLAQQKLLLLYAQEYIAKNGVGIAAVTDESEIVRMSSDPKNFLSVDEQRYCIEMTNKQFTQQWETEISALETKDDEQEDETEEDEDLLAARPVREKEEESTEYEDLGMTDAAQLPKEFQTLANEKIAAEKDNVAKKNMEYALSKLNDSLKNSYMDYSYYLRQQQQQRVIEKYRDALGKDVKITQEELDGRYQKLVNVNLADYIDDDAYASALEGSSSVYYHRNTGYLRVRSILLKFSEEQDSALSNYKAIIGDNDSNKNQIERFRAALALGKYADGADNLGTLGDLMAPSDLRGIQVNVSNPDYDAEKDQLKDAYTDLDVDYMTVLYAMANSIAAKKAMAERAMDGKEYSDLQKQLIRDYAANEAFTDWMYLVNDDSGMFSNSSYLVTPDGKDTSYVSEYTVLARRLADSAANAAGSRVGNTTVTPEGNATDVTLAAYSGTTTALSDHLGAKSAKLYARTMTTTVETDAEELSATVYTLVTAEGNSLSFIVNDFGIHIVMLTEEVCNGENSVYGSFVAQDVGFVRGQDYLFDSKVRFTYNDEKTEITEIKVEFRTIAEYLNEAKVDEVAGDLYTQQSAQLNLKIEEYVVKHDKIYEDVRKAVQG